MKVTLNWLKQYVDFNWSSDQLTERLTMLGLEVEHVKKLGGEFEGVVVAQVLSSDKHPNADKLSVCRVADGSSERQIVCGAKNYKVGDKVPLALPGSTLPTPAGSPPFTIKVGKIRGVESQGMMCSAKELGLSDDAEGLLILPPDARVGQPFAGYLGRVASDVVYDLEITPNRPDLNSVIGIAREIAALTGNGLKIPAVNIEKANVPASAADRQEPRPPVSEFVTVQIEDPDLCPRYVARMMRGVKVGPSPAWLKEILEKVGLRSINNIVDVTSFVMLETGQPLHAFDYHLLAARPGAKQPGIVVHRATEGETFVTLDGQRRTLTNDMLLIADETKPIALAGIMGGQNTEINLNTADVLLESACFKPQNIRATSKKLDLKTDASYRFERGADEEICDWASRRAVQLIAEVAGGEILEGAVDAWPRQRRPIEITLRHHKTNDLLGIEIPGEQQVKLLVSLGLKSLISESGNARFRVPSFRVDLKQEVDLIEEIARLHGLEKIPATAPRGVIGSNPFDAAHDELAEARRLLTGLGLNEFQTQTLVSLPEAAEKSAAWEGAPGLVVELANPLSMEMSALRPTLLFGLLDTLKNNLSHKTLSVAGFEIGRVFSKKANNEIGEERRLALGLTGRRSPGFWSGDDRLATHDLLDAKGILEEFFEQFGVRGLTCVRETEASSFYSESATIQLGRQIAGRIGQVLPKVARHYDLPDAVLLAELNLDLLLARRNRTKSFKALPVFPSIRRDVAMIVPESTTHEAVLETVRQAKPENLEIVELFDIFRGKNVAPGQKSLAYAFTYRNAQRTLTDGEVNATHEKLVERLKTALPAVIRE